MTGLVERLLDENYRGEFQHLRSFTDIDALFSEAAAEITRLQAENASLREQVEKAREALEPFSKFAGALFSRNFNSHEDVMELDPGDGDWIALSAGDFFEARRALKDKEERGC